MFDKKHSTLEVDEADVELACTGVEKLRAMIEASQSRIIEMQEIVKTRLVFYNAQQKRLTTSKAFCEKLLAVSTT